MIEKCGPNEYKIRLRGIGPTTLKQLKMFMESDPTWSDVMSGKRKPYMPINLCENPGHSIGECGYFKNLLFENNRPYIVIESHGNCETILRLLAMREVCSDINVIALPDMDVELTDHGFVMTKLKRFDLFVVPYCKRRKDSIDE